VPHSQEWGIFVSVKIGRGVCAEHSEGTLPRLM